MGKTIAVMLSADCDGCGFIQTAPVDDAMPGFEGTVMFKGDDGYMGQTEWYACKKQCIPNAVLNRLSEVVGS